MRSSKHKVVVLALFAIAVVLAATARAANEKDAVGTWKLMYDPGDGQTHEPILTITQGKAGLKAELVEGDNKLKVKEIRLQDGELHLKCEGEHNGEAVSVTYKGKLTGDTIKGEGQWEYQGMSGSFLFTGKRVAEKPRPDAPSVVAVPGKPSLPMGSYDVASLGYQVDEFFISGTASSYKLKGEATEDGKWDVKPAKAAPYTTRLVVVRPSDPKKFSGTVVVEWMNVSGGLDAPADWNCVHREIVRRGSAFVGVSAQRVGIEGGRALPGVEGGALKKASTSPPADGQR